MAELLKAVLETTTRLERMFGFICVSQDTFEQIDIDADPTVAVRIEGSLLLRKARIHAFAVLRANESNNLHSLAVQMRPVLECVGQLVFKFQGMYIDPDFSISREKAYERLSYRINADFYQTLRRVAKGKISGKDLRQMAKSAEAKSATEFQVEASKEQKSWGLKQVDKLSPIDGGPSWYSYLSEYFCHGSAANLRRLSCRGGVLSIDTIEDEFTFLGMMAYLVDQVARMNAAASLYRRAKNPDDHWQIWVEPALTQLKEARKSYNDLMSEGKRALQGNLDGRASAR